MKKAIIRIFGIFLVILLVATIVNIDSIRQLRHVMSLFDEDKIVDNFLHMEASFPVSKIRRSEHPTKLAAAPGFAVPPTFQYGDSTYDSKAYMDYSNTNGLLVIHRDTIVHESYYNGMLESTTHISWSMAKSFVSALTGIALEEGLFDSVEDPITKYLPELVNTGYNQVRILDILQMSSGVKFDEDYRDFNSDINKFGRYFALGKSFTDFVMGMENEKKPGTYNHYVSINTQVLGMLVTRVSGRSLTQYLQEKIWEPVGMEHNAQWITDKLNMEMALGGLNISLRDYGKFGLLYMHKGNWKGKQIVPESWIEASVQTDAPHLEPGPNPMSNSDFGYGYQWWVPEPGKRDARDGDFFAAGIYNQYIYISPERSLVIVKLSANHHFKEMGDDSKNVHVALLQGIAREFPVETEDAGVAEEDETAAAE
jgi:CubicO group peptidase (beta-lactamase class C family)